MPPISPARVANVATHAWTKLYTEIMNQTSGIYERHLRMGRYLKRTQSTTVFIKFRPPVSGLPSSVEGQISATRASTSVVFASGP